MASRRRLRRLLLLVLTILTIAVGARQLEAWKERHHHRYHHDGRVVDVIRVIEAHDGLIERHERRHLRSRRSRSHGA